MNSLCRLISHSNRASSQRSHLFMAIHSHFFSSTKPKTPKTLRPTKVPEPDRAKEEPPKTTIPNTECAKPSQIPFQSKVANSVNLIGFVHSPVQFQTTSDGSSWAATVITQNVSSHDHHDEDDSDDAHQSPDSLPLWVPVIFEGDLAHVAACHIKENDRVYVSGQLSSSLPHINGTQVQASVQLMVRDINFIENPVKVNTQLSNVKIQTRDVISNLSDSTHKDKEVALDPWKDLIDNPKEWYDNRDAKKNRTLSPKFPDFKRKDGSQILWLNRAPKSLLKDIQGLEFGVQIQKPKNVAQSEGLSPQTRSLTVCLDSDDPVTFSWKDLANNTTEWRDYRKSKLNGKVNPKYPDFKRKDGTGQALWLSSAPKWILPKLEGLEFEDVHIQGSNEVKDVNELWKDLVDNPNQWWDNRVGKTNERAPDFKHKKTGEVLWLKGSPSWVSSKLPAPKAKGDAPRWNVYN